MTTEVTQHLGRRAEDQVRRLIDGYELGSGFELACVIGPSEAARAEVAARFGTRVRVQRLEPRPKVVETILRYEADEDAVERPVVWIEARRFAPGPWETAITELNIARDRIRDALDGLLVLAGPNDVLSLVQARPDLASVLGPVVRVDQDPSATAPLDLRWLHLADLLFRARQRWDRRPTLRALLRHLREEVVGTDLAPDLVLVTGDIALSGQAGEYDQAEAFFLELMDTLGLDTRHRLLLVPGNHDVDWQKLGVVGDLVSARALDSGDQDTIQQLLADPHSLAALGERLEAFYAFTYRLLGPARAWSADRPWRADRLDIRGCPVGVVQLNSVWASGRADAAGRLLVGHAQASEALAELPDARLRLALVHHPPAWLAPFDGPPLEKLLASDAGVDFLLHGHVHDEDTVAGAGPAGQLMMLGTPGTFIDGHWHRGVSLVRLDGEGGAGEVTYLTYSDRGGGLWHRDAGLHPQAPDGTWRFELPAHLRRDAPARPARQDAANDAAVTRYRLQSATVHGRVSLLGLPDHSPQPQRARVADLFAPLEARPRDTYSQDPSTRVTVAGLVERLSDSDPRGGAGRVVLLGDPGSGKTTLTQYLTVWAAGGFDLPGVPRPDDVVPLRVVFRELAAGVARGHGVDLIAFLVRQAAEVLSAPRDRAFFESLLEAGRAIVFLDGLDEVGAGAQREQVAQAVSGFAGRWPRAPILVTSRIAGYEDAPLHARPRLEAFSPDGGWRGPADRAMSFDHLVIRDLSDEALEELVRRWYRAQIPNDARAQRERTADLLAALRAERSARDLARNPLLATLVCLVHRQSVTLPAQRVRLYEKVVTTLLESHPATKGPTGAFREIDVGLQRAYLEALAYDGCAARSSGREHIRFERTALSMLLARIATERGSEEDVVTLAARMGRWIDWLARRTGLLVEQRPDYLSFLHLTLMEYLAARAWSERTTGIGGDTQLVEEIVRRADEPQWREVSLLVMGLHAQRRPFCDRLARSLLDGGHALLLAAGLLEDMRVARSLMGELVDCIVYDGPAIPLAVLANRETHGADVRTLVQRALRNEEDPRELDVTLLNLLPSFAEDAEMAVELIDRLRRRTSDIERLAALQNAVRGTAIRWPDAGDILDDLQRCFIDHLQAPRRELFEVNTRRVNGPVPPFRIAAVPVTNAQHQNFDPDWKHPEAPPQSPVGFTLEEARLFCRWLSQAQWATAARIPTRAEWSAAYAGGALWSVGDAEWTQQGPVNGADGEPLPTLSDGRALLRFVLPQPARD